MLRLEGMETMLGKCKFWKTCKKYNISSHNCNENDGIYGEKFAECYLKNQAEHPFWYGINKLVTFEIIGMAILGSVLYYFDFKSLSYVFWGVSFGMIIGYFMREEK